MIASARTLARVRTYAPDGSGKRHFFFYRTGRTGKVAGRDLRHIFLAVCACRTVERAGRFAVCVMVAHKQLQRERTRLNAPFTLCVYHGIFGNDSRTGAQKLGNSLLLHKAYAARAVGRKLFEVTQIGNFNSVFRRSIENGFSAFGGYFFSVYNKLYGIGHLYSLLIQREPHRNGTLRRRCRT